MATPLTISQYISLFAVDMGAELKGIKLNV
jgi:hypothetical protein